MKVGDKVILMKPGGTHINRRSHNQPMRRGTEGVVVAIRRPVAQSHGLAYLVKFKDHGGNRHCYPSQIVSVEED